MQHSSAILVKCLFMSGLTISPGRYDVVNNIVVVSNNNLVRENLSSHFEIVFVEGSLLNTLEKARDLIHTGYRLLTHPLSGSIKPNFTPYKTVVLEKREGKVDTDSLLIMEDSICRTVSLLKDKATPDWPDKYLRDFSLIDYDLIKNALKL